jgi:hypothetical protein
MVERVGAVHAAGIDVSTAQTYAHCFSGCKWLMCSEAWYYCCASQDNRLKGTAACYFLLNAPFRAERLRIYYLYHFHYRV